ncbi:MAG: metallophosphoesterase family protein [Thermoanaerobaculia bacterium]|nr:metallophosphoesterase family protein [Thermoanaerobaculia bacterium]
MRYLILADLHGNLDALETVLAAASEEGYDEIFLLGDLVGYGAGPNEVVEAMRAQVPKGHVVRGNHDKVVAGIEHGENFNEVARLAARWTREQLSHDNLEYLVRLPRGPLETGSGATICHGSPLDEDEYVLAQDQGDRIFRSQPARLTFFGHTHLPTLATWDGRSSTLEVLTGSREEIELREGRRYLFNPGSVGQPRDRDPRAAYAIYDAGTSVVHWRRVRYPVESAQRRIYEAGLPAVLAYRLAVGL